MCEHLKAILKDINLKLWFHDRQTCLLSNSIAKCVTILYSAGLLAHTTYVHLYVNLYVHINSVFVKFGLCL